MGLGATNMHFFFFSFCDSDINWIITNQIGACNHLGTWCALLCIHLFTRPYNIHAAPTANFAGVKKILFRSYNLLRKIQASKRLNQICAELNYFCDFQPLFIIDWKYAKEKSSSMGDFNSNLGQLLKNRSQKAENDWKWLFSNKKYFM